MFDPLLPLVSKIVGNLEAQLSFSELSGNGQDSGIV